MRALKQKELKEIDKETWEYKGYFIHRIFIGAQVGGDQNSRSTRYEVAESLEDLRDCIGFPRFTSLTVAKNYIRERIRVKKKELADDWRGEQPLEDLPTDVLKETKKRRRTKK